MYNVKVQDALYDVKIIPQAGAELFPTQWYREMRGHQTAVWYGYGPGLVHFDEAAGYIITDSIQLSERIMVTAQETVDSLGGRIKSFVTLLGKIHQMRADELTAPSWFEWKSNIVDVTDTRLQAVMVESGSSLRAVINFATLQEIMARVKARDVTGIAMPCVGDASPFNMMNTPAGYKFLNYDFAGQEDPLLDVAAVVLWNFKTPGQELAFLHAYYFEGQREYCFALDGMTEEIYQSHYREVLTAPQRARYNLMKKFVLIRYGMGLLAKIPAEQRVLATDNAFFGMPLHELIDQFPWERCSKKESVMNSIDYRMALAVKMLQHATL